MQLFIFRFQAFRANFDFLAFDFLALQVNGKFSFGSNV